MSSSLAAAKKRRAPGAQEPSPRGMPQQPQVPGQQPGQMSGGLTLPQVIQLVDRRLVTLETFMKETKEGGAPARTVSQTSLDVPEVLDESGTTMTLREAIEEFDKRYEMLAEEIVNIKNIVLSLQSYTMEVNKTLMEERVRILSDLEEVSQQQPSA